MKTLIRYASLFGAALLVAVGLTACGGGGDSAAPPPPPLAAGTFTKSFVPVATNGNYYPFNDGDLMYQNLYLASEINGSGNITTLRFQRFIFANAAAVTCPNTTIKLGHTILPALTATFANNVQTGQGSLVTVLNNATLTIPAGAADAWFDVPLTTPFAYNGSDNLVVQIDHPTACSDRLAVGRIIAATNRRSVVDATDTLPGTAEYNLTTGIVGTAQPLMQFVFAGGDNKQDYGGALGNNYPFRNIGGSGLRTQNLYLAANINGSGPVTGIGFQMNATSVAGTYTYSLTLGHSTLTALTSTFANNYSGTPVTVANAVTFTIPAGVPAGEWIWVPIPAGVFSYNGSDNLIIDVATTSGTADNFLRTATIAGSRVAGASATATTGDVDGSEYHIELRFHGGGMSKLTAGAVGNTAIFNAAESYATLYSATDLGTAGTITSVSCHLDVASVPASYANFKVVMGHATGAVLSGTAATDFVSQNTVFNGTVVMPALLAGDWLDIPLTTPFVYDGKSNLIVWMGNNGTASGTATANLCRAELGARYPNQTGLNATGVGTTYTPMSALTDIRMAVRK